MEKLGDNLVSDRSGDGTSDSDPRSITNACAGIGGGFEEETGAGCRLLPAVYVFDGEMRMVGHFEAPTFAEGAPSNHDRDRDALLSLLREVEPRPSGDAASEPAEKARHGVIFRAVRLSGGFSGYVAWIEPQWRRETIRDARARTRLSAREREILDLLVRGFRRSEIARSLGIAETTAQSHVRKIGSKLGCSRRSEIVARALGVLHLTRRDV
jgi:DNA-binding CsgD family transcriptional regulator